MNDKGKRAFIVYTSSDFTCVHTIVCTHVKSEEVYKIMHYNNILFVPTSDLLASRSLVGTNSMLL